MQPVLVIPGFMGSSLNEVGSGRRTWVEPTWAAANAERFLESLELRTPGDARLAPSGILHDVNIGDLIRVGIYRDLHEFCLDPNGLALPPGQYHEFAYDWRKPLAEAAASLATTLRGIPDPPVTVIAHSQGGLVLTKLFLDNPEIAARVGKVFAVGCPFAGLVKTIAMVQHGTGILASLFPSDPIRTLLRAMPGAYELFPSRAATGLFRDPSGAPARPWDDRNWFPPDLYDSSLLKAAGTVISRLPLQLPVPLRIVEGYGVETATLARATPNGGPSVEWTIQGDGTCPARSLTAATGTEISGVPATATLSVPFAEHVELIRRREFFAYLRDDLTGTPRGPQIIAVVKRNLLPPGAQNTLIIETRDGSGRPLGAKDPPAVQSRHGVQIQLEPCPIAGTARWLGHFHQPPEADQIVVTVAGNEKQPPPILIGPT